MMSDFVIFGLMFATYITQLGGQAGGPGPHDLFEMRSAFFETMLLLASSFTFGLASVSLKYSKSEITHRTVARGDHAAGYRLSCF